MIKTVSNKILALAIITAAVLCDSGIINAEIKSNNINMEENRYIAPLSDNVNLRHVNFKNRYGVTLSGDLYTAKNIDTSKQYPALIVGAPYGGVKEQGPCVYANELAQRGFVVLTFDAPYMGESGGEPRNISGPEMFTESFSAATDYLGIQDFVDREKIGVIGICGSGGFALSAAAEDPRIKAVATASLYDMSRASRLGMTEEQIQARKEQLAHQRWLDYETGTPQYNPTFPDHPVDSIPADMTGIWREFFEFYATARGFAPGARGGFTTTSDLPFMNYPLLEHIREISPRPVLIIAGENAESKFFSDTVYENAADPKEYLVIPDCNHIDLYDGGGRFDHSKIPFDKLEQFFKSNLK